MGKGDLPLKITWTLNEKEVTPHTGVSIVPFGSRTSLLTISYVTAEHAGEYSCHARNKAGHGIHSTLLLVNGIHLKNQYFRDFLRIILSIFSFYSIINHLSPKYLGKICVYI